MNTVKAKALAVSAASIVAMGLVACETTPNPTPTAIQISDPTHTPAPIATDTPPPSIQRPTVTRIESITPSPEMATPPPTETLTPVPTDTPVPPPKDTATPVPTDTPVPPPTETATPVPTDTPVPLPTETATPVPTDTPVPLPTDTATPVPTDTPVPLPTDTATPVPTDTPVPLPTDTATPVPTDTPVQLPTETSTPVPEDTSDSDLLQETEPESYSVSTDRTALEALYEATDGANWANNSNWVTDGPMRGWHGVVTGSDGRVTELKLEANNLTGEIPAEIGNLSELKTLALWENNLTGEIPEELGKLSKLSALFLDSNQLTGEIPGQIGQLQSLNEFWLNGNQIGGEIPASMGQLTQLTNLFLNNNLLTGSIPAELGQMKNLVSLNIGNNRLTGNIPEELGRQSMLEELLINDNLLTGELPDALSELTKLKKFGFTNSGIKSCLPKGLSNVPIIESGEEPVEVCGSRAALTALYSATDGENWVTDENWLSDRPLQEWHGIDADDRGHIFAINLARNNLNGSLSPELGQLEELRVLTLFENNLSGEFPLELVNLNGLDRFFVGGNQLDGCVPAQLHGIRHTDLNAIGLPTCVDTETTATPTQPPIVLAAFSVAANEVNLTWHHDFETIASQIVYRDGELVATPSANRRTFSDIGLRPSTNYAYRIVTELDDGTVAIAEAETATLASLPRLVAPIDVSESGFSLAIHDVENPPDTSYQVKLIGVDGGHSTEWSGDKCRTFAGLMANQSYWVELRVRNQDKVETYPVLTWFYESEPLSRDRVVTQASSGNDDPWTRQSIERLVEVYGLTEQAMAWMLADIRVIGARDRPSLGGYTGEIEIGYPVGPKILSHELMHGFWSNWNGFDLNCENLNHFTFRRDLAKFMLDFRDFERSGQTNPWDKWEPFYDFLVGITRDDLEPQSKNLWDYLEEMKYRDLWDGLFHMADTEIPTIVAGNLALVPPPLQPYFEGFIAEQRETTWADELRWYSLLTPEDRRLWDNFYFYNSVIHYSPQYSSPDSVDRTDIDETLRQLLWEADRQQLVDFINTLEGIVCEIGCEQLWDSPYAYWDYELDDHLYRYRIYFDQIEPSTGIELDEENLAALGQALEFIVSDFYCGMSGSNAARQAVDAAQGISDLQRAALNQIIDQIDDPTTGILTGQAACRR